MILRKRRKIQATTTDSALDDSGAKGAREKRKVAGRRGYLKLMTEIPIDTLHEIFRQLDPADLLNLSWASKSLRLLIMEKSARYIWHQVSSFSSIHDGSYDARCQAFERLYESSNPPPGCPQDLSLPQYTRFLFYKKCMVRLQLFDSVC
jgi:hypothetical protein